MARFLNRASCSPARVLDVGSGSGDTLLELAEHLPDAELVGVDLCQTLLDISRRKASERGLDGRVRFEEASATALPYDDVSFDVVFSQDTLHMVDDPVRMLNECARVLKPGGVARIRVIRRSWLLSCVEGIFRSGFTRHEIAEMLAQTSFEQVAIRSGLLYVTSQARR
ncbi:MAG: class I SAM-dependent methyltransferase [Phycisphaerae bacterium]|nr:class I SAM-dependent methyltransferase [Phycisphaerae bacterium]